MTRQKGEKRALGKATYIPKVGANAPYQEVIAQQFDGEEMKVNTFEVTEVSHVDRDTEEKVVDHYTTQVRTNGQAGIDVLQKFDFVCIAEGVQRFVMGEKAFKAVYKRKN
jgi:hypothetical protein